MKGFLKIGVAKILVLLLACVFALIFWSYERIDDRFVITVDGYGLQKSKGITVGDGSDIVYDMLPNDCMTLSMTGEAMTFSVDRNLDTLLYYRVNGENPNLHIMNQDSDIVIDRYGCHISISINEVRDIFKKYSSPGFIDFITGDRATEYIMLRHVIALLPGVSEEVKQAVLADDQFQSFVYSSDSSYKVCILDKGVTYAGNGYVYEKTVMPVEGLHQIQFFKMAVNAYKKDEPGNTDVEIDSVCYAAKPVIITTGWGAGHITIRPVVSKDKLSVDISFPKGVTYVDNLDSLVRRADLTSDMMTVSQEDHSFPIFNNIYLTAFSDGVVPDLASLSFARNGENISVIDASNDTTVVSRQSFMYPAQQKIILKSDSDYINVRTAVLDRSYWLSYMVFPTLIYVLMLIFSFITFGGRKMATVVNKNRVEDLSGYFNMLLTIMYAYVLCKLFIAIKLSFTYPYFEKLSGIIVTSTSLMLLLMTSIAFLLNIKIVQTKRIHKRRRYTVFEKIKGFFEDRKYLASVLVLVLGYGLCLLSMYLMDNGNHLAVKNSYLFSNITFFTNPLDWPEHAGVNDTHRSVCYTLFAVEAVILVAICWRISKFRERFLNIINAMECVQRCVAWYDGLDARGRFNLTFVLASVALVGTFFVPGNYATALITLVVILALSRMVITYDDIDVNCFSEAKSLFLKVIMCVVIFFMAILPDQGYMVSWIGLIVAVLMFPVMTCRVEFYNASHKKRMNKTFRRYVGLGVAAVLLLVGMRSILSLVNDPDEVSWSRLTRRVAMFSDYDKTREAGYRYSEADMEFMQIMCHYMQDYSLDKDPFSNETNPLHKSVSTGQSPVVLNDVSAPAAFFGPLGWPAHIIFFFMLIILMGTVMIYCFTSDYTDRGDSFAFSVTRQRLIAMLIWLGASVYLYMSYLGCLPYTGRLIHGYGVDSVGEALEICVLLGFMSSVAIEQKQK